MLTFHPGQPPSAPEIDPALLAIPRRVVEISDWLTVITAATNKPFDPHRDDLLFDATVLGQEGTLAISGIMQTNRIGEIIDNFKKLKKGDSNKTFVEKFERAAEAGNVMQNDKSRANAAARLKVIQFMIVKDQINPLDPIYSSSIRNGLTHFERTARIYDGKRPAHILGRHVLQLKD